MANKAVSSAIGLAGLSYLANERFKDYRVRKEREYQEQLLQDRHDEYLREREEAQRKKGHQFAKRGDLDDDDADLLVGRLFAAAVYSRVEEILYGLAVKVGERGRPPRNENLRQLDLPLMSNEPGKEDLMLAAAFALGDADVVNKVAHLFPRQSLGLGLKKFTPASISRMLDTFQAHERSDLGHDLLAPFVNMGIYSNLFRGGPRLVFLVESFPYSEKFRRWGEKFGFHVLHEDALELRSRVGSTTTRVRYGFNSRSHGESGRAIMTNFFCDFEVRIKFAKDGGSWCPDFSGELRMIGRRTLRREPDFEALSVAFADKIAEGIIGAATTRLSRLFSTGMRYPPHLLSHDHIAVMSGNSSALLKSLRESDRNMILAHRDEIAVTLRMVLKKNVPLPDETVTTGKVPLEQHQHREISVFVDSYIKLVDLSYCEVPLLGGKPPSSFVPEYSVGMEAKQSKDCVWEAHPLLHRAIRRRHEREERERLAESRTLVAPGKVYSWLFIALSFAMSSLLSRTALSQLLKMMPTLQDIPYPFVFVMNQGLTLWSLYLLAGNFAYIFDLREEGRMSVVTCCTEYIQRAIAVKLGRPTPYDQEMTRLGGICRVQYREWKLRIAKRDFDKALKRKRIGHRESILLLMEFADAYYVSDGEEILEGTLPAELNEAEDFLKMKVDEGKSPTEFTSISPEEALENYLASEENRSNRSSIDELNGLSAKVQECVQFSVGDRVTVSYEEDETDDSSIDSDGSKALVCRRSGTGSVAFSTMSLCFVYFDGMHYDKDTSPTPVPIHLCSLLEEDEPILALCEDVVQESEQDEASEETSDGDTITRAAPQAKTRARTVEEALAEGGWKFERAKKHVKYSRRVKLPDGQSRRQSMTMSKTPSDHRAGKNALALIRRLNEYTELEEEDIDAEMDLSDLYKCSACRSAKHASLFSKAQQKKGEKRRCRACVTDSLFE